MTKTTRRRRYLAEPDPRKFGHFVFFLRNVMIRHTHKQKYRGTDTTLMSLPPKVSLKVALRSPAVSVCCSFPLRLCTSQPIYITKTERTIEVEFTDEEKQEYTALDTAARDFYVNFKDEKGSTLSRHFLLLSQKLTPLRVAASGGHIPLEDEKENEDGENENEQKDGEEEDSDNETETKKKKARKKKTVKYSDFAYTSKFNTLVTELKHIRDNELDGKFACVWTLIFVERSFSNSTFFSQPSLLCFRSLRPRSSFSSKSFPSTDFNSAPSLAT
jgi:hypothetical protein